jgi:nicotinate-nucleotide--dimethylbenzimidazole phosphoribosyltransferase
MGIGNTSAASLIMSRITGIPLNNCVGAGTGLDSDGIQRKIFILEKVLKKHPSADSPLAALACFGGFEIATMIGAILQAAEENRVIVVDGFITTAAVLVAQQLYPHTLQRCLFAHCSQERPHAALLEFLGVTPLLKLEMRLGEGSGAAIAWPLILSSTKFLSEMASFEAAGVSAQKK